MSNVEDVVQVTCGENHCLALTKSEVFVWGDNKFGQLGLDPACDSVASKPVKLSLAIKNIDKIFSGWTHNVLLTGKLMVIRSGLIIIKNK